MVLNKGRRAATWLGALASLLGMQVSALPPAGAPISGDVYTLLSACGGKALDVRGNSRAKGAPAQLWSDAGSANQRWQLQADGGYYSLTARHSGKVLSVQDSGALKGTDALQLDGAPPGQNDGQLWTLLQVGANRYTLAPKRAPQLRLDVAGARQDNGARVQLWDENGTCAQTWRLVRVAAGPPADGRQALQVSEDKRFLVNADGRPFFYLADTAWELFHRLNREQARRYLKARSEQGFTVVQAVALAELDGLSAPNAYGALPLLDKDPARPALTPGSDPARKGEYDYWDHVDYVVNEAAGLGLHVALLPTWGSWVNEYPIFDLASAKTYGQFLGKRYKDKNVLWVLGGDRDPSSERVRQIWRAMAAGIGQGAGGAGAALISYHPGMEHSSAQWFHQDAWLDFNILQTGHCRGANEWEKIAQTYALKPAKPVLNAEPIYEGHPVCFDAGNGYSDAADVRTRAYWSTFAGAFGHTYGHHAVWQMHDAGRGGKNGPKVSWQDALSAPGAGQMRFLRRLITSRPMLERVPDQSLLQETSAGAERVQATRGSDYAFVYSAAGKPFTVNLGRLGGRRLRAAWFDPRNGESALVGSFENVGARRFVPPSRGRGQDWVLLLDSVDRAYPLP